MQLAVPQELGRAEVPITDTSVLLEVCEALTKAATAIAEFSRDLRAASKQKKKHKPEPSLINLIPHRPWARK